MTPLRAVACTSYTARPLRVYLGHSLQTRQPTTLKCLSGGHGLRVAGSVAEFATSRRNATTATAAIFHGVGKEFEIREIPIPELQEGEILLKLDCATVCGSDLHTVSGKRTEPTPLILGHEGVGVIEQIGSNILSGTRPRKAQWKIKEGDRVTFSMADSCGICPQCTLHKLPQKCQSLMKYGHTALSTGAGLYGTYATHILLKPGTHVVKLPDGLSSRATAPVNCALATVANALDVARLPRFGSNNSAIVQGAGLLGIYAVAWLKKRVQMEHVFCVDWNVDRLKTAEQFGAIPILVEDYESRTAEEHTAERAKQIRAYCPHGVDVVVEMTGVRYVLTEGVDLLRNGGHYAFCGMVHPDSVLSTLTAETIIRKCLTIRGVHNYTPWNLAEAVQFLREYQHDLPFEQVLSPQFFALRDINQAFAAAFEGKHCRVVIDCQKV